MIETKIKCDYHGYSYSYEKKEGVLLAEAIAEGWYEIQLSHNDLAENPKAAIRVRQPKTTESFVMSAKHACCPAHARSAVEALALELIPDEVKEAKSAEDIPY